LKIILVILVMQGGYWVIPKHHSPREQPSMEVCEQRAAFVRETSGAAAGCVLKAR